MIYSEAKMFNFLQDVKCVGKWVLSVNIYLRNVEFVSK